MKFTIAQLPEPPAGQDRVFTTDNAVIVMDGATTFESSAATIDTVTYVERLGSILIDRLATAADEDLREILAESIARTRDQLDLAVGRAPTSTVSIARVGREVLDLLVLGDSPIIIGRSDGRTEELVDNRVDGVAHEIRARYRARLASGAGFDDEHRILLGRLQQAQRSARNRPGGFYVAEALPDAAHHALTTVYARNEVEWLIMLSDGVFDPLTHLGLNDWPLLVADDQDLQDLLAACVEWEEVSDPTATLAPRAKRSDDKSLVTIKV